MITLFCTVFCCSHVKLSCSQSLEDTTTLSFQPLPKWLHETLAVKIANWTQITDLTTSSRSLRLVSLERYNALYCHLKEKYGPELVQVNLPFTCSLDVCMDFLRRRCREDCTKTTANILLFTIHFFQEPSVNGINFPQACLELLHWTSSRLT